MRRTGGTRFVQPREETALQSPDSGLPGLLRRSSRRKSHALESGEWLKERFGLETS